MSLLGVSHGGHFPGNHRQQWFPSTVCPAALPGAFYLLWSHKQLAGISHSAISQTGSEMGYFGENQGTGAAHSQVKAAAWLNCYTEKKQENAENGFLFFTFWSHHPQDAVHVWFPLFLTRSLERQLIFLATCPLFFPQLASWQCWELQGLTVFWKEAVRGD